MCAIPPVRQRWARHYGVHPYFTRRPPNVVLAYIERYSNVGDTVLDPFGGSGVTAIEAMLAGRMAIHNDLNPLANFITATIGDTSLSSALPLREAFHRVEKRSAAKLREIEEAGSEQVLGLLNDLPLPANIPLPRSSDAERFYDLFTPRQLAGLAVIKQAIETETDRRVRDALLLAWSASAAKLNKTFLSAKGRAESRGGSSIFSIYRYKLAKEVIELPVWETFRGRFRNVLAAKEEVIRASRPLRHSGAPAADSSKSLRILSCDAADLTAELGRESVDYIFTDPPYGGNIAYLDLSILWNHWLGFEIPPYLRQSEAIVGGECEFTDEHYREKLSKSIRECVTLLKPDRWFSVVFQHWNVSYFASILESACDAGADLRAAVVQEPRVIWSMHKKKNSESVLAGEMILTFYKSRTRSRLRVRARQTAIKTLSLPALIDDILTPPNGNGERFTTESIFNRLVLRAWNNHSLSTLSISPKELANQLRSRGWEYDPKRHLWTRASQKRRLLFS